jgi:hypothetical protein
MPRRALPADHGWPPFRLVCDIGHRIDAYADFPGQDKNYAQFPDRQGVRCVRRPHRIALRHRRRKALLAAARRVSRAGGRLHRNAHRHFQ